MNKRGKSQKRTQIHVKMSWSNSLHKSGLYYEGWVEDLDSILSQHGKETVTCYGTRRSRKTASSQATSVSRLNIIIYLYNCIYIILYMHQL